MDRRAIGKKRRIGIKIKILLCLHCIIVMEHKRCGAFNLFIIFCNTIVLQAQERAYRLTEMSTCRFRKAGDSSERVFFDRQNYEEKNSEI